MKNINNIKTNAGKILIAKEFKLPDAKSPSPTNIDIITDHIKHVSINLLLYT